MDAIGKWKGRWALAGLGAVEPYSEEYAGSDAVWQWMKLEFGQTILVKRRPVISTIIKDTQIPVGRAARPHSEAIRPNPAEQSLLPLDARELKVGVRRPPASSDRRGRTEADILDEATEQIIRSNFDERLVGQLLMRFIDQTNSIETAVAFAAIVSKARLARLRRK